MKTYCRNLLVFGLMLLLSFDTVNGQSLKKSYEKYFDIGAALGVREASGTEKRAYPILVKHFNSLTPENLMKWGSIHPRLDEYNFGPMDNLVELAEKLDARE